jgi:hypothetical protein
MLIQRMLFPINKSRSLPMFVRACMVSRERSPGRVARTAEREPASIPILIRIKYSRKKILKICPGP